MGSLSRSSSVASKVRLTASHVLPRAQIDAAEDRMQQLEQDVKRALATCRAERTRAEMMKKELEEEKQVAHILVWLRVQVETRSSTATQKYPSRWVYLQRCLGIVQPM